MSKLGVHLIRCKPGHKCSLPLNMFLNHSIFTALKSGRGIIELSLNAIKIVFIRGVQCVIKERWITDLTIIPRAVLM